MENRSLRRSIAATRQSFFDEGILDEQFARLERLQDRDNPFLEDLVTGYLRNSTRLLATVEQEMNTAPINLPKMDRILDGLWRSSTCVGANKVRNGISKTMERLQAGNLEGAKVAFQNLRNEHDIFKTKLEPYFEQLRHAGPTDTPSPPSEAIMPRQ